MTKQDQVKAIFIEEAGEIIDKLDVDIIRFEEDPTDTELLNEIFRGVHTLKGNSNAFGFTRMGEFVHHFEDILSHYRSTKEAIAPSHLELMVKSVDIIKEVMRFELEAIEGVPQGYLESLEEIKRLVFSKNTPTETPSDGMNDLALEFGMNCPSHIDEMLRQSIDKHQHKRGEEHQLFRIDITLDRDCYKRGFDHLLFLKLLKEQAIEIESFFDFHAIEPIENFTCDENGIEKVSTVLLTSQKRSEIEEYFEFLFDHEYAILEIEPPKPAKCESSDDPRQEPPSASSATIPPKSTLRIDTQKLDELFNSVGELVIAQNFIAQNELIRSVEDEAVRKSIETLSKITKRLQDRVMGLRMVAIRDTFDKMKRVVRDTSKKTSKEVKLVISGEETEIDKTMIDLLADPLTHILRNAIDHGLESRSEERIKAGKSAEGTVKLEAFHKSGTIVIRVSDDGRGIDKERVKQKAIEKGLIRGDEVLSDGQVYALIMQPGFSTASEVSDLSGRGVGLDVVRTGIEKLRGKIEVDSKEGEGTTFSLILPLTLAIIDGMLVRLGDETYIIPTLSVVETLCPPREIVHHLKEKGEFVTLRGNHIPIVRLSAVLECESGYKEPWEGILVCIETQNGQIALMVDQLIGRQQVVIKTLGKSFSRMREISGGAILGSGDIALILNVDELYAKSGVPHVAD